MSVIRCLVVDTGVQPFVIIIIKIVGDADLRVGQVGKNGPLAGFADFGFEARPETFRLRIVVAIAPTALRAQGLVVVEQLAVGVAAILPALPGTTAVGMHEQARRRRLRPISAL